VASSGARFSSFLKENRVLRNLTQSAVAEHLGVTRATVNRWENSPAETCPLQVLDKAAKLFDSTPEQAIGGKKADGVSEIARQAARVALEEKAFPDLSPLARNVAVSLTTLDESELADVADFIETIIRNRSSESPSKSKKLR
jgi:transcriptional regulator with XRE-family HTH domain